MKAIFNRFRPQKPLPHIVIVSGLPRSGTSMMMKMLEAGGLPPLTDRLRTPDDDNPQGYYEFERVKKLKEGDAAWLAGAQGKAVKVISALLTSLPAGYHYKVIFMRRAMPEILASQRKMLVNRGEDPEKVRDEELAALYEKHLAAVTGWLAEQANFSVLFLDYSALVENPVPAVEQVERFLTQKLDAAAMAAIVDPDLFIPERVPVITRGPRVFPAINPDEPRIVHGDLSKNLDSAGIGIGHFGGYKEIPIEIVEVCKNPDGTPVVVDGVLKVVRSRFIESRPITIIDLLMRINPPPSGVIDPAAIRGLIYTWLMMTGAEVELWSYDQFQSQESMKILENEGYTVALCSVDRTPVAYQELRSSHHDRRFSCYEYTPYVEDMASLEWIPEKNKVDHRNDGSKDASDCAAAICHHVHEAHGIVRVPMGAIRDNNDTMSQVEKARRDFDQSMGKAPVPSKFDPLAGMLR